jgi:general secretion pathway protein K
MYSVPFSGLSRRAAQRGSALLMVIFLITTLYMIVYAMHSIVKHDVDLAISQKQAFRARQVAEMGINWAMNPAVKPYDRELLDQTLEDGATFSVKIRGEGGRININAWLQKPEETGGEVVKRLFTRWLAPLEAQGGGSINDLAEDLYDKMIDWTDADSNTRTHGAEKENYITDFGYGETTPYPFNRPFYSLDEMLLVPGFDLIAANLPDWRDYFTIYSGGGGQAPLDLDAAEAKVIAALGLALDGSADPADFNKWEDALEFAQQIVETRWGNDETEDTEDDKKVEPAEVEGMISGITGGGETLVPVTEAFGAGDQTVHIECVATVGDYRKRVVLIVRGRTAQPQILSREEVPLFQ